MAPAMLATCDRALPADGTPPEWVHLLPEGKITGRDGRRWDVADPGALVLAFAANGADLPIDFEHQNDNPEAKARGPIPAAGWIKDVRLKPGGVWGRVEWTAAAREMIAAKQYRYLSPTFYFEPKTGIVTRLKGAGLVHNPNLHLVALASQETHMDKPPMPPAKGEAGMTAFLQRLAAMLDLPEGADEDAIMAKLAAAMGQDKATAAAQPDPARFVPVETVAAMLRDRNGERVALAEGQAVEKVNVAINQGYLPPALKDWALALARSDADSFDAFLAKTGPHMAKLFTEVLPNRFPEKGFGLARSKSAEEEAVCAQLGLKPGSLST